MADGADDLPGDRATLVALELIRRAIADLPQAFARNLALGRGPDGPEPKPISPANPAVVMTPDGPDIDPLKVLAPKPPAEPGAPGAGPKTHQDLARLQKDAARDLAAAAKQQKAGAGTDAGGRGLAGSIGSLLKTVTNPLAAAFGAILPPLNLLAGILGSATSGFSLITRTMQLLYAVLAPVLLPVMFLFAAGLMYVSDLVMKHLWPAFSNLWKAIGPTLVAGFEALATAVGTLVGAVVDAAKFFGLIDRDKTEQAEKDAKKARTEAELRAGSQLGVFDTGRVGGYVNERGERADPGMVREVERAGERAANRVFQERGLQPKYKGVIEFDKQQQAMADRKTAIADREVYLKSHPEEARREADRLKGVFAEGADKFRAGLKGVLPEALGGEHREAPDRLDQAMAWAKGTPAGAGPGQRPPAPKSGEPSFKQAMLDMLKAFDMSMGPKAQFGDLGASQVMAAQLAVLNTDPIEQRMLAAQQFAVQLLQKLVDNTEGERGSFRKD